MTSAANESKDVCSANWAPQAMTSYFIGFLAFHPLLQNLCHKSFGREQKWSIYHIQHFLSAQILLAILFSELLP